MDFFEDEGGDTMPHEVALIATIAAGFGLALVFGFIVTHLRMPPLVGYLLAGVMIGPATPGFVGDMALASQLAEIGVMLLMFGVGLHFSFSDLLAVRRIAIPGAIVQIVVATALGFATARWWGWEIGAALVFGLSLSVASTVVLLRALEVKGLLDSMNGRIAVGWLVVEDLLMVLVLVFLPALAEVLAMPRDSDAAIAAEMRQLWLAVGMTLAKVAVFVVLMLVVGRRIFPKILWWVARTGSRELFTLCIIAAAIGVAFGAAELFDVSFALGAFFAGMMLRESEFCHRAAAESLPFRDAFAVLFFVSVGMLFEPAVMWQEPGKLLAVVGIILLGKTIAAVALVLLLRYPLKTALVVGAGLAQIGEFSFILAGLGMALGLLPSQGQSLILAGALVSMAANPAIFALAESIYIRVAQRRAPLMEEELVAKKEKEGGLNSIDSTIPKVILIGYGAIGQQLAQVLHKHQVGFSVIEQSRELSDVIRKEGGQVITGDAAVSEVLLKANIVNASILVVTIPDMSATRKIIEVAKGLNPEIQVILRTYNEAEAVLLQRNNLGTVFLGDRELARSMATHVISILAV